MPRDFKLSWDQKDRRWKKYYKGRKYQISCRQLGAPETKEGSYRLANEWWQRTKAEIDGQPRPLHPDPDEDAYLREVQAELIRRKEWAERHRQWELAKELAGRQDKVSQWGDSVLDPLDIGERVDALHRQFPLADIQDLLDVATEADDRVWAERYRSGPPPAPTDRTIGYHVGRYLDFQRVRQRSGQISVSDYDQTRQALEAFRGWIGPETSIDSLNAERWESWYLHLLASGLSKDTKRNRMRRPRDFIGWLASKGLIPPPSNLLSRKYRFKEAAKPIVILTDEEVAAMLAAAKAKGILRLHLLLSLNCGMGASEISNLTTNEVDWKAGRIIRKRHKTQDKAAVPTVNYKLWPETFALLKQWAQSEGDRVLLTQSGLLWVRDVLDENGQRHRVDAVRSLYAPVARKLGLDKPFYAWRRTAASKLDAHPEFKFYGQHFLGDAPQDIARTHYQTPSQDRFDAAVKWLGKQYGLDKQGKIDPAALPPDRQTVLP